MRPVYQLLGVWEDGEQLIKLHTNEAEAEAEKAEYEAANEADWIDYYEVRVYWLEEDFEDGM